MKPVAGGVWIFLGVVIGIAVGWFARQPSLGLVGGLVVGLAVAAFVTIRDLRRENHEGPRE